MENTASLSALGISRLGIGTVQFGQAYGINNIRGQVPYEDVVGILTRALEAGVNYLDTARAYGDSENALGKAIRELGCEDKFIICTKLDLPEEFADQSPEWLAKATQTSLQGSREALGLEHIPILLLHRTAYRTAGEGVIWDYLIEQREKGFIGHLGVSVAAEPAEARECLEDPNVEIIQIPYNAWDGRWERRHIFELAMEREVLVVNRSSYLQGLLLMDEERAQEEIPAALSHLRAWWNLCEDMEICPKDLALRYTLSEDRITTTIVGNDTLQQFEENLELAAAGPLPEQILSRVREVFAAVPDQIVIPSLWDRERRL